MWNNVRIDLTSDLMVGSGAFWESWELTKELTEPWTELMAGRGLQLVVVGEPPMVSVVGAGAECHRQ
jgi:hypothetical protein